jgi:Flp pilus assembly protein TadD
LDVAQQKFEEILSTLVEEYGETHKRVGTALHNLGIVHMRAGNYDDAVDAIQAAVRIRVEKLGEYNPKVAVSSEWHNLFSL